MFPKNTDPQGVWRIASGSIPGTSQGWDFASSGTVSHPSLSTGSYQQQSPRTVWTQNSSGQVGGIVSVSPISWRGSAPLLGGFIFRGRFSLGANPASSRCFVGLSASGSHACLADPSTVDNSIGMGFDASDSPSGYWYLILRDGGATTKILLDGSQAGGTATAARNTSDVFDFLIHAAPNASDIHVYIANLTNGTSTVFDGRLTSSDRIPEASALLFAHAGVGLSSSSTAIFCLHRLDVGPVGDGLYSPPAAQPVHHLTAAEAVEAGRVVGLTNGGIATPTTLLHARPFLGVAVSSADVAEQLVGIQTAGLLSPSVVNLGAGPRCAVGVDASGALVRSTSADCVSAPNWVGDCDAEGFVVVRPRRCDFFNVVDFGAVGDASTDDIEAIEAAMAAMKVASAPPFSNPGGAEAIGEILFFPQGVFRVSRTINVKRRLTLRGVGGQTIYSASVIFPDQGVVGIHLQSFGNAGDSTSSGTTIEGITIYGNTSASVWSEPANWAPATPYSVGNCVMPVGNTSRGTPAFNPLSDFGQYLECIESGTSATTEHVWKLHAAAGGVGFVEPRTNETLVGMPSPDRRWVANHAHPAGEMITEPAFTNVYKSSGGLSGASAPNWASAPDVDDTLTDGTITWTNVGLWPAEEEPGQADVDGAGSLRWKTRYLPHGILTNVVCTIRNVYIGNVGGNGIHVQADVQSNIGISTVTAKAGYSNANSATIIDGAIIQNCRDGVCIIGSDVNGVRVSNVLAAGNRRHGFRDRSFLGCTFITCDSTFNAGGSFTVEGTNAASVLVAPYTEGDGQPPVYLGPSSISIGGLNGAGYNPDSLGWRMGNNTSSPFIVHNSVERPADDAGRYTLLLNERAGSSPLGWQGPSESGSFIRLSYFLHSGSFPTYLFNYGSSPALGGFGFLAGTNRGGVARPIALRGLYVGESLGAEPPVRLTSYPSTPGSSLPELWRAGDVVFSSNAYSDGVFARVCAGGSGSGWQAGGYGGGWAASAGRVAGEVIVQSAKAFRVRVAGQSGTTLPGGFATVFGVGDTVSDGTVVWELAGSADATFIPMPLQGGYLAVNLTSNGDHTLLAPNERSFEILEITDTTPVLDHPINIILPGGSGSFAGHTRIVKNSTGQALTFKTASGSGVVLLPGQGCQIACDGANWLDANGTLAAQAVLTTNDASPGALLHAYTPPNGAVVAYTAEVVAKKIEGGLGGAWFQLRAVLRRDGSSLVSIRAPEVLASNAESNLDTATAALVLSGTTIRTEVQGVSDDVRWALVRQAIQVL